MNAEPVHPGRLVRGQCLQAYGLSVMDRARVLGVTRQAPNNLVNGHCGLSPGMALRLAKAFGCDTETWFRHQLSYDLGQARKRTSALNVIPMGSRPAELPVSLS